MNPLSAIAGNAAGAYQSVATVPERATRPDAQAVAMAISAPSKTETPLKDATKPSREAVESAAKQIQHFVSSMQRQVSISKDDVTGYIKVQIINPDSGEVIRTLPSDELIRIAHSFEQLGNVMVHQKA
jgi:flagellar protein FlaG